MRRRLNKRVYSRFLPRILHYRYKFPNLAPLPLNEYGNPVRVCVGWL